MCDLVRFCKIWSHLLLESSRTGHSPLMLGPLLVHYRKEYRNYNYFLSTLCALNRKVQAVKAVGTDGEKNLVDAVLDNFHQAAHIRCFIHLQQNVELHLHEQKFPTSTIKEYVHAGLALVELIMRDWLTVVIVLLLIHC